MDNYFVLFDLRSMGVDGFRVERVLEFVYIVCNKNIVLGDVFVMVLGGLCIGILVLILCGFIEKDFE